MTAYALRDSSKKDIFNIVGQLVAHYIAYKISAMRIL
jgi:hypothetical protein